MQKILTLLTSTADLRSAVEAWDWEDADCINPNKEIGLSPAWPQGKPTPRYERPVLAMADGWKLMSPPVLKNISAEGFRPNFLYEWWFSKD